jgi:glycosyltransferase involved in cell wall biosynthesis
MGDQQLRGERGELRRIATVEGRRVSTLVLAGHGSHTRDELRRLLGEDAAPDAVSAEDAIGAAYVDAHSLARVPGRRGELLRRLPLVAAQTAEVLRRGKDHDAVLTWSDMRAIAVAAATYGQRRRPAHVAILIWPSRLKKAALLRLTQQGIDRFIVPSPLQRRFMEEKLGIAPQRFVDARYAVDTNFWRPREGVGDLICSVGQEMRDYKTLVEALRPMDVRCHIAAGAGAFHETSSRWWSGDVDETALPPGVTLGSKSFPDLRALYARSRFVVVPLRPTDSDNGISTILEAFAMGKAVICTETPGQTGLLEHGVNCLRVPPFDVGALREAIRELWDDEEKSSRLGAAGREAVVDRYDLSQWTDALVRGVEEAVALRAALRARPRSTRRSRLARPLTRRDESA